MAKKRASSAQEVAEHPLSEQLDRLCNELQLTRQVLDELRTDVQWAIQNRLLPHKVDSKHEAPIHNLLPVYDEGDAVEVNYNRLQQFGEIVSVDDAENSAVVLLIPSNETITVPQDSLSRVEADSLRRACVVPASCVVPNQELAETDETLSSSAGNGHLF